MFIELHIEQGPVLEGAGVPVGVCTGVQGTRWYEVVMSGVAAHAGTTPRSRRRDAMEAASGALAALYELASSSGDDLRLTIGRVVVEPGTVNTVPERVTFTVDARHPDEDVLDRVEARLGAVVARCGGESRRTLTLPATRFDRQVRRALADAAELLGVDARELVCGAFHDAVNLAGHCPTGMVLVPSTGGVSHHPSEATDPADIAAGARVLAVATALLARRADGLTLAVAPA